MLLFIIFLVFSLACIFIGIYIGFSKDPFAKKNLWKTGMCAGMIFITAIGIIPMIVAGIQEAIFGYPQWGEILVIPLIIPFLIMNFIFGRTKSFGLVGNLLYFTITSLLLFGGLGAFIGYVISIFIPSEKNT